MSFGTGAIPPPKMCPVCGKQMWSDDERDGHTPVWPRYRSHLSTTHPDFAIWDRKMFLAYYLAALPFFGFSVLATQVTSVDLAKILAGFGLLSGLVVLLTVRILKRRGEKEFRQLWKETHAPVINS